MTARDANDGDGSSAAEIQLHEIQDIDSHLEEIDGIMNEIEDVLREMNCFLRLAAEYQPYELEMINIDVTQRDCVLFSKWKGLKTMEEVFRPGSSRLQILHESLQYAISCMAVAERAEKSKELKYKQNIEKERAELETEVKSKFQLKEGDMPDRDLRHDMEQIRFEIENKHILLNELKYKAETQRRRIQLAHRASDFLLTQAGMLRLSIEQERFMIAEESRRRSFLLTGGEAKQQEQMATVTMATVGKRSRRRNACDEVEEDTALPDE